MSLRILLASPPAHAVGGVAAHTATVVANDRYVRSFDQWWPLRSRSPRRTVRLGVHGLGLLRWWTALVTRRPDVVHLQVTSPGITRDLMYLRIARRARRPVVAHLHTSGFLDEQSNADGAFAQIIDGADALVVMSDLVRQQVIEQFPRASAKVYVVPNPAPALVAPQASRNAVGCRFLCVGEISDLKGQAAVARAVEFLAQQGLKVSLDLVGPRGSISEIEWSSIASSRNTRLHGVRRGAELAESYANADVFVLFSRTEAEPMSMLESMAAGIPVIMTAVGSIPATLAAAGGKNALVAVGDEDALREAMRSMAESPEARLSIGAQNREWVRANRSVEGHVADLHRVYESVWTTRYSS